MSRRRRAVAVAAGVGAVVVPWTLLPAPTGGRATIIAPHAGEVALGSDDTTSVVPSTSVASLPGASGGDDSPGALVTVGQGPTQDVGGVAPIASGTAPSAHPCGGDLPPCWVMLRESGGDPTAVSPVGYCATGDGRCRGKWQADAGTWAGFGGYANADEAPEDVQDAWARVIWAGGAGCANWAAC